jgi:hypothetical protein
LFSHFVLILLLVNYLLLLLLHHSFFEQKACTMIQFAKVMVFSEIKKKTTDFFTFGILRGGKAPI